jgi:hypothetical protein
LPTQGVIVEAISPAITGLLHPSLESTRFSLNGVSRDLDKHAWLRQRLTPSGDAVPGARCCALVSRLSANIDRSLGKAGRLPEIPLAQ